MTPTIVSLVAEIAGEVGRLSALASMGGVPKLRRENRIRSIHASLAIENNTLSLDQVTAVIEGKRVLGQPREIQEVKNAFAAYEAMAEWNPASLKDLLAAHRLMLEALDDHAGKYRSGAVGIAHGREIVHLAPPADRVSGLMKDLLDWLKRTDTHPLIAGCVFHYELEFIHPFADGNGRMGRLWQTLILSRWNPLFAFLPVETVIHDRQADYYKVLAACDRAGNSTSFIEFLLDALLTALREVQPTDQVSDQVTDQVKSLIKVVKPKPLSAVECMSRLSLSHRPNFRANYLNPALDNTSSNAPFPKNPTAAFRNTGSRKEGKPCWRRSKSKTATKYNSHSE